MPDYGGGHAMNPVLARARAKERMPEARDEEHQSINASSGTLHSILAEPADVQNPAGQWTVTIDHGQGAPEITQHDTAEQAHAHIGQHMMGHPANLAKIGRM